MNRKHNTIFLLQLIGLLQYIFKIIIKFFSYEYRVFGWLPDRSMA